MSETGECVIKLEKVKEESDAAVDNSTEFKDPSLEVKDEVENDEELELPLAVVVKEEAVEEDCEEELELPLAVVIKEEAVEEDCEMTCSENSSDASDVLSWAQEYAVAVGGGSASVGSPLGGASGGEGAASRGLAQGPVPACTFCHKTFTERTGLIRHMRIHTGEKPFACSVCERTFTVRCNLVRHMRMHTGEKPFACSLCEKTFRQNKDLVRHMCSHTGVKPYACSACEKTFIRKEHLDRHVLSHTEDRNYTCSICNRTFARKDNLLTHMRAHKKGEVHMRIPSAGRASHKEIEVARK